VPHQAGEQAGLHEGGLLGVSRTTAPCAVVARCYSCCCHCQLSAVALTIQTDSSAVQCMQWSEIILIG
jgi:hypothetical protein